MRSLTGIFFENWNFIRKGGGGVEGFGQHLALPNYYAAEPDYRQPYVGSPLDHEQTGESVYINLIDHMKRYVYFTTSYLIIADGMN